VSSKNRPKNLATSEKSSALRTQKSDFAPVFLALKKILQPYEKDLRVASDKLAYYALESRLPSFRNKPVYFAGVRRGKNYVSFYLMPVYMNALLLKSLSPELRNRMQGKACFNFKSADPALFRELSQVTSAGFSCFRKMKFL